MSIPTNIQFFSKDDPSKPDIAFLKNHFYREGRVTEEQAMFILEKGTELLRNEPNLLEVDAPITGECSCLDGRVVEWRLIVCMRAKCAETSMDNM